MATPDNAAGSAQPKLEPSHSVYGTSILARQQNNDLCDILLYGNYSENPAEDTTPVKGHKLILGAASPHLRQAFAVKSFVEAGAEEYRIDQIDPVTLQLIVDFIYQSKLRISGEDAFVRLEMVLTGAHYLLMPELVHLCGQALDDPAYLTIALCVSKWLFAEKYDCKVLASAAVRTAATNLEEVGNQDEFLNLLHEDLTKLIKSFAETPSTNCDTLCDAVMKWFDVDEATRKNLCDGVMRYMPFHRMTSAALLRLGAKKFLSADVVWKVRQMQQFCAEKQKMKIAVNEVLLHYEWVDTSNNTVGHSAGWTLVNAEQRREKRMAVWNLLNEI